MADTATDQKQTTDTQSSTLRDQARAAFGSIFSANNLIPLDQIKRLGVYTEQERPQLVALFEHLTKLIDSRHQLIDSQEIIVKLLRQGVVKLRTENTRQFGDFSETEQQQRLFFADLIQLISDIGKTLYDWDKSEHLKAFGNVDEWYWLKEIGREEGTNQISNIFTKEDIANKLQEELVAPIWSAIRESEPDASTVAATTTGAEISGAKVDGEAVTAALAAVQSASSGQADATDGAEAALEQTTQQQEESPYIKPEEMRLLQYEQQNLLILLQQELYENFTEGLTTKEIDQLWSDFEPGLIAELTQFLGQHPDLRAKLLSGGTEAQAARATVFEQFLATLGTNQILASRLTELYEEIGESMVANPGRLKEFEQKLAGLSPILGTQVVAQIKSHTEQIKSIREIPQEPPIVATPEVVQTTAQEISESESKLQAAATEYLTTHAEYEIFKKTRIYLQTLSAELDLSAQNIRRLLADQAHRYALGLTPTQLRFLQTDPMYARAFFARFLQDLQRTSPDVGNFLRRYRESITDSSELQLFERTAQNGVLAPHIGKDALQQDLALSLGGAATSVVSENVLQTIDAIVLNHGAQAPEFIASVSTDRLELIFGLPSGALNNTSLPEFLRTVQNHMQLRLTELKTKSPYFDLKPGDAIDAAQTDTQLAGVAQTRKLAADVGGAEILAAAASTKGGAKTKEEIWNELTPAQRDKLSQLMGGTSLAGQKPVNFDSFPISQLKRMAAEVALEADQASEEAHARISDFAERLHDAQRAMAIAQIQAVQNLNAQQLEILAAQLQVPAGVLLQQVEQADFPTSPLELSAATAAVAAGGADAFAGIEPGQQLPSSFMQRWGQQGMGAIRSKIGTKIRNKALGTFAKSAATKLGLTATGVGAPIALGLTLLQNKNIRDIAIGGAGMAVANTLYSLSTYGGALGAVAGGLIGGPLGAIVGANVGALIPGLGGQWTGLFGWNPHLPVSPFSTASSSLSSTSGTATNSMQAMRGIEPSGSAASTSAGSAAPAQAGQQLATTGQAPATGLGGPGFSSTATTQSAASSATTATTSSSLTGFLGTGAAAITATAAPLIGIGISVLLSMQVLFIIYAAFLIKVPSEGSFDQIQVQKSKYVTLTKKASQTNLSNAVPAEVSYTIEAVPKGEYAIKITSVADTFISLTNASSPPTSTMTTDWFFPTETTTTQGTSYKVILSGVDDFIVNTVKVQFDVYNGSGVLVLQNEVARASAAVRIGNPKVGCWPTSGSIAQLPGGNYSHDDPYLEAFDIMAPLGTPIYAPFAGSLKGYSSPSGTGYGEHGVLTTNSGQIFYFGHMIEKPANNPAVMPGDVIGYVGNTGYSTGPHLHYEVRDVAGTFDALLIGSSTTQVNDFVTTCFN